MRKSVAITFSSVFSFIVDFIRLRSAALVRITLVVIIGLMLIRAAGAFVGRCCRRSGLDNAVSAFVRQLVRTLLIVTWLIILCTMLGVPTTSLIALLSAAALAVSLALRDSFSNVASGFLLIFNRPIKENDFVEIAGVSGIVKKINLMSTMLVTPDNKVVTVPNNAIVSSSIIDYSTMTERRVDLTVSVAYGSDVALVKDAITTVIESHGRVLAERGITVRLAALGESALAFDVRAWTYAEDYRAVLYDLNEQILAALNEAGITIPFRQLEVSLRRQ